MAEAVGVTRTPAVRPAAAGFRPPERAECAESLLELVGATPVVRLGQVADGLPAPVYVKLDHLNVGGSSKDRIALSIVHAAERSGELAPGVRIIDNGAGNTAIGFALVGVATGHPVTLVANPALAPAKADLLRLLGVEILAGRADVPFDDPENWEAIAARHADEDPTTWWSHQSATRWNPQAHEESTGPEIWHQTGGAVTSFVAAVATGGTVSGTGRYLKARNPAVRVVATDFVEGPSSGTDLAEVVAGRRVAVDPPWPHNLDTEVIDAVEYRTRHDVVDLGWRLARSQGLVLGLTSVLSVLVALDLAASTGPDDLIVAFSADHGRDYLSREYNATWLRANGLADVADRWDPADDQGPSPVPTLDAVLSTSTPAP